LILIDANLLIYAYDDDAKSHDQARTWLERKFQAPEPVAIAWTTILAFLRIGTNPRLFGQPLSIQEAVGIVDEWLSQPEVVTVEAGERYWAILRGLLPVSQARGPNVMDAQLAALAIENGATLCTADRGFARFPGLRVEYPLE
jgi:hypothetical protein